MPKLPAKIVLSSSAARIQLSTGRTTTDRGYGWRWQKLRKAWLAEQPRLCVECLEEGIYYPAEDVDHIIPHCGREELLYDRGNLQGLCHRHHSQKSAKERRERV